MVEYNNIINYNCNDIIQIINGDINKKLKIKSEIKTKID